jgi:hypothetical protein
MRSLNALRFSNVIRRGPSLRPEAESEYRYIVETTTSRISPTRNNAP